MFLCFRAGMFGGGIGRLPRRDRSSGWGGFLRGSSEDEAEKVWSLKGLTVGTRKINVEVASEEAENKEKKDKNIQD